MTASVQTYPSNRSAIKSITAEEVREALMASREIALLDVREEAFHAEGHPLFAANLSLSRIEIDALRTPTAQNGTDRSFRRRRRAMQASQPSDWPRWDITTYPYWTAA